MNFRLRSWKDSDRDALLKYANNPKIASRLRNSFPFPYSAEDAQAFLSICHSADPEDQLFLAIEVNGEAVGSISVAVQPDIYCRSAEVGYWLAEPFWGNGIMSKAIREICKIAFERFPIVRIFAEPFANNFGSRRALEKAGFALEGILKQSVYKQERLLDSCIYALLKEQLDSSAEKGETSACNRSSLN